MAWIDIQLEDILNRLTGPEVAAIQTKALATNQTDPIPEIIQSVSEEVRGYVANCPRNIPLGNGITIPSKLRDAAISLIIVRAAGRLPTKLLLTDERVRQNAEAITLLTRVADCKFAIDRPDPNQLDTEAIGVLYPSFHANRRRRFGIHHEHGI